MNTIDRLLSLLGLRASPERLTRKAAAFAAREDVLASVEQYKKALALDSLYIPAYDGLGKVYFRMGFKDEADREFAIADGLEKMMANQIDAETAIKMGQAMLNKGLNKQAAALLDPVLKKNPKSPGLYKIVGLACKNTGSDKKARDILAAGLERWPRDPDFYLHLGSLELKAGRKEEGEKLTHIARLMSKVDSDLFDAHSRLELARVFMSGKMYAEAGEYLRQAVAIDGQNVDYWQDLGECYHLAGQNPAAVDAFKKAALVAPADPRPQKSLAKVYQHLGRFNEAKQARELAGILEGGQSGEQNPAQIAKYVKYLLSIGLDGDAEQHLKAASLKWPASHDLRLIQGRFFYKHKKYEEAIRILKEVAQAREAWAEPHLWMAMAYQRLGDAMSALAEGQLATRLAPKSHAAHKVLGDILREQKKFGMAENAYETAENLKKPSARE